MVVTASLTAYAKDHDAAALANTYTTECDKLTPEDKQTCIIRNLFALQHEQIQQLHNRIAAIETPPTAINKPSAIPHIGGALSTNSLAAADKLAADVHLTQAGHRFWLAILVTLAGVIFLSLSLHYLNKISCRISHSPNDSSADEIRRNNNRNTINIVALHLIVFGMLIVIIAADVTEQINAAVGIFGTLAGYIFRGINDRNA